MGESLQVGGFIEDLWAKTPNPAFEGQLHLPLRTHLADACEAASRYWDAWLAPAVKRRLAAEIGDEGLSRRLVRLLAALHDYGKCCPAFAGQVPAQRERLLRTYPDLKFSALGNANTVVPHGLAGAALATAQLLRRGWAENTARSYVSVIAGHHGRYPVLSQLAEAAYQTTFTGLGMSFWSPAHDSLFEWSCTLAGLDTEDLERLSHKPLSMPAQIELQALIVLADWCASDTVDFPLSDPRSPAMPQLRDPRTSAQRASDAWSRRAIPSPWAARYGAQPAEDFYRERFGWAAGRRPRETQSRALGIAREVTEPGLMIIEAAMGLGKTEAALAVAEVFAERVGAGGLFFGLPTMATSDGMFPRVIEWVDADAVVEQTSVYLAHSKASYNRFYSELPHTGDASVFDDFAGSARWATERAQRTSAAVIADALSGRRTGMFANVVVGTIDQLLMVGLNTKHFVLRHLAMSGKVVVLDEIHSADRYMRSFLVRALEWLGAYGTPVVLLSATLPPGQREELLGAYLAGVRYRANGRGIVTAAQSHAHASVAGTSSVPGIRHRGRRPLSKQAADPEAPPVAPSRAQADVNGDPDAYPLITWTDGVQTHQAAPRESGMPESSVEIVRLDDDLELLVHELRERMREGGCVLIVRNTVNRAIELYDRLLREPGLCEDLQLVHSRFLAPDRSDNDELLRERFGPPSPARRRPGSRHPAIVVSTQVAEQSLDVDFDLLVTDLAPADLVLQRIGRLHRHRRDDRPGPLASATCILTGVAKWAEEVPHAVKGSERVYGRHMLLRTVLAFARFGGAETQRLRLPADIPRVVRETYSDDTGDLDMSENFREALEIARKRQEAKHLDAQNRAQVWRLCGPGGPLGLYGASDGSLRAEGDELARAVVRDGEDTFEIILMQRGDDEATLRTLDTLSEEPGLSVPIEIEAPRGRAAYAAARSTIRLPPWMCTGKNGDTVIEELERQRVPSWQEHPLLRGQLVLVLDENLEAELAGHRVRYSRERGLELLRLSL